MYATLLLITGNSACNKNKTGSVLTAGVRNKLSVKKKNAEMANFELITTLERETVGDKVER